MEILYLGGLKQTFYFDTGRLQGYPLCEMEFFHFLIGSSIRDWSIEMWEVLPQKLVTPKNLFKKNGYSPKNCYPKKLIKKKWLLQKNVTPKNIKKNGYPKNVGVLYCEGVYYCILEKWCTLLRTGLLMRFKTLTLQQLFCSFCPGSGRFWKMRDVRPQEIATFALDGGFGAGRRTWFHAASFGGRV